MVNTFRQLGDLLVLGKYHFGELFFSFVIVLFTVILRSVLAKVVFARLKSFAARTSIEYDDRALAAMEKPLSGFFLVAGIYLAIVVLPVDPEMHELITIIFRGATMVVVFWGLIRLIDVAGDILADVAGRKGDSIGAFVPLMKKAVRVFVFVVGIIMVIDNLGYSVGGILAAVGLGGAAFAFAAKDSIANLYGSFALALDRPFQVGDWIQVGDRVDGDVEEVGLRSTKVRTWPKTVISIPNNVLANEMINNWSRMPKRRVKQIIGVTYETKPGEMEGLVHEFRHVLQEDPGVHQEFILVNFTEFGDSSLNILVYYFTTTTAWLEHMDVRQRVNISLMRVVEARGLSIAFPTRTLYFEGELARQMSRGMSLPGDFGPTEPN